MECPRVFCFWVLVFVSQLWLYGCFGCFEIERNALLELKSSFDPLNRTSYHSWRGGTDCCSWLGVRCDPSTGRVTELDIDSKIDEEWGDWYLNASLLLPFEELQSLSSYHNALRGFIDEEELTRLRNLEMLDLSANNLMGPIPPSIGSLTSLKFLDLSWNRYNGSRSIQVFSVAHNNLSGKIPDMKLQFATFNESSYDGNPLLCGSPLNKSCISATRTIQDPKGEEEDDDDDSLVTFYAAFVGSYSVFLLGTIAFLYFTSQRLAVCFLHVIDSWCGFLLYKICVLFNCK
ncbi:hypothetical protein AAC387_Pa03g0457 [Persea americana]